MTWGDVPVWVYNMVERGGEHLLCRTDLAVERALSPGGEKERRESPTVGFGVPTGRPARVFGKKFRHLKKVPVPTM